jgi:ATPase subunit of ABC transporter with duplicated ATPase domains
VGGTVKLAYVDQQRDALNGDKSVFQEVTNGADVLQFGRAEVNSRAYLSWFNFRAARS